MTHYQGTTPQQERPCGVGPCVYWWGAQTSPSDHQLSIFFFRNKYGSVCVHECVHMCEEEIAWRKTQTCRVVLVPLQMEDIQKESEGVVKIF